MCHHPPLPPWISGAMSALLTRLEPMSMPRLWRHAGILTARCERSILWDLFSSSRTGWVFMVGDLSPGTCSPALFLLPWCHPHFDGTTQSLTGGSARAWETLGSLWKWFRYTTGGFCGNAWPGIAFDVRRLSLDSLCHWVSRSTHKVV